MMLLLYAGPTFFGIPYQMLRATLVNPDGSPTWRKQHQTIMFHTFVMMNWFNMFNCRKIPEKQKIEWNILKGICNNDWFLIIILVEVNI